MSGGPWMKIGTRGSPLALAQAREMRSLLAAAHDLPEDRIALVVIKTTGDMILDRPLSEAGGKGLFTKELDIALLNGDIDIAVHSSKDLPTLLPDGIDIAGYLPREDVRDVFISPRAESLLALAPGSLVGTASLRRQALVRRLRPDLRVGLLRGNVQTRLAKLASGECDATLLALAGLKRLGMVSHATEILDEESFLPAVGQGAIGVTARADDHATRIQLGAVLDAPTGFALILERAFLRVLDGSCRTPIAGHARIAEGVLHFRGQILRVDGTECYETLAQGAVEDAERLGIRAGSDLLARAPSDILAH
ncbi:MAG: hydroxymethylbilane synthase [Beijerinckiaceae bacterium]|jgi:hydroxymethylbilane synthase|nr:hydroxymethylbilane synthase [Beijerinckiaceae bacterium]